MRPWFDSWIAGWLLVGRLVVSSNEETAKRAVANPGSSRQFLCDSRSKVSFCNRVASLRRTDVAHMFSARPEHLGGPW